MATILDHIYLITVTTNTDRGSIILDTNFDLILYDTSSFFLNGEIKGR